ncbi:hypothetical protein CB0940_03936 [Cercospora beticola]|uniref:Uncharacterized protein n=1 Tax=Cercospora beticola TaxID=122368 RepID=A0A2G5HJJ8_CERBT|nr:hypothetical protein CB0940_03936 [Cercospora beticola]PIA92708.1 hypothetical protein CB0940_03936 [Cercospora beticola]
MVNNATHVRIMCNDHEDVALNVQLLQLLHCIRRQRNVIPKRHIVQGIISLPPARSLEFFERMSWTKRCRAMWKHRMRRDLLGDWQMDRWPHDTGVMTYIATQENERIRIHCCPYKSTEMSNCMSWTVEEVY